MWDGLVVYGGPNRTEGKFSLLLRFSAIDMGLRGDEFEEMTSRGTSSSETEKWLWVVLLLQVNERFLH
jgi:hypothetical protein